MRTLRGKLGPLASVGSSHPTLNFIDYGRNYHQSEAPLITICEVLGTTFASFENQTSIPTIIILRATILPYTNIENMSRICKI